jgi:hypothetical protein
MTDDPNTIALKTHLQAFVPLQIAPLERGGGINDQHIEWAQQQVEFLACKVDILFNGCGKPGDGAKVAGTLTKILAILSLTTPGNRERVEGWMRIEREPNWPEISKIMEGK